MLFPLMVGGLTGRLLKLGLAPASALLRPAAYGVALFGEASAFELASRSARALQGERAQELFSLRGEQGLGRGILHSMLSFAALKGAGSLTQNAGVLLQHSFQSAALVLGHDIAASLNLQEAEQGGLISRLAQAELMNVQFSLSSSLLHSAFPGLHALERSLDLRAQAALRRAPRGAGVAAGREGLSRMAGLPQFEAIAGRHANDITIVQEVNEGNFHQVLETARLAARSICPGQLRIVPQSLHPEQSYAPLMKLWAELLPEATKYRSLSMKLGGITLRYSELPNEINVVEGDRFRMESPRMGTLVELREGESSFEEMTAALSAFRRQMDLLQQDRRLDGPIHHVRTDFPESMGHFVRASIYDAYSGFREWLHGASGDLVGMNAALERGETLTPEQRERLQDLKREFKALSASLYRCAAIWRWVGQNRAHIEVEAYEGPTVGSVAHDFNNRLANFALLDMELRALEAGQASPNSTFDSVAESLHVSVRSAVREGLAIAGEMAERSGIQISFTSQVPAYFNHVLLREDAEIEMALVDILGNLASNMARYHNPNLDPSQRRANLAVRFLPNGDLEFTASDNGIGILPENFDRIGRTGFQELRREVKGSEGKGLSSVIQILRERGFGPLWIRTVPGEGSAFRFVLSKARVEAAPGFDPQPANDEGPLANPLISHAERNLEEGYLVPPASMDLAIRQVLEEIPRYKNLGSDPLLWQQMLDGSFRYRRLQALHRLLSGPAGPEGAVVVDNAHGAFADLFLTAAQMGSHVWLKEPDSESDATQFIEVMELPEYVRERVHRSTPKNMDAPLPVPARISYWSNPNYSNFELPFNASFPDYLGRDVAPGGYLVIQNGRGPFEQDTRSFRFDPSRWRLVYQTSPKGNPNVGDERVLPTASSSPNILTVYQRIQ